MEGLVQLWRLFLPCAEGSVAPERGRLHETLVREAEARAAVRSRFAAGQLLGADESQQLEYKGAKTDRGRDLLRRLENDGRRYANAFANSIGGVLLFGVTDKGVVQGAWMTAHERDAAQQRLSLVVSHWSPPMPPNSAVTLFLPSTAPAVGAPPIISDHYNNAWARDGNTTRLLPTVLVPQSIAPAGALAGPEGLDVTRAEQGRRRDELVRKAGEKVAASFAALDAVRRHRETLAAYRERERIVAAIATNSVTIVTGPTGCGKSTQVPQIILEAYTGTPPCVIVAQPRRLAAVSLAHRVAEEMGKRVGEEVGFHIGANPMHKGVQTRLLFVTTGVLKQYLALPRRIGQFTHIVVDEVHERHIDTDICLALLRQFVNEHPTVKVALMSATIDPIKFQRHFGGTVPLGMGGAQMQRDWTRQSSDPSLAPVIALQGNQYPVRELYLEQLTGKPAEPADFELSKPRMSDSTKRLLVALVSDIGVRKAVLVFLPGIASIREHEDLLSASPVSAQLSICVLHSSCAMEEQHRAMCHAPQGKTKLVLATNLAESSLTIPDVSFVIDTCLCREVYRLIPRLFFGKLPMSIEPEIQRCPLEDTLLRIVDLPLRTDPLRILSSCPDPPDPGHVDVALEQLVRMNVIARTDRSGAASYAVTALGWFVVRLPLPIKLGVFVLYAHCFGLAEDAIVAAAVLARQSPIKRVLASPVRTHKAMVRFSCGFRSDVVAAVNAFRYWEACRDADSPPFDTATEPEWCGDANWLSLFWLREVDDLAYQLREACSQYAIARQPTKTEAARRASLRARSVLSEGGLLGACNADNAAEPEGSGPGVLPEDSLACSPPGVEDVVKDLAFCMSSDAAEASGLWSELEGPDDSEAILPQAAEGFLYDARSPESRDRALVLLSCLAGALLPNLMELRPFSREEIARNWAGCPVPPPNALRLREPDLRRLPDSLAVLKSFGISASVIPMSASGEVVVLSLRSRRDECDSTALIPRGAISEAVVRAAKVRTGKRQPSAEDPSVACRTSDVHSAAELCPALVFDEAVARFVRFDRLSLAFPSSLPPPGCPSPRALIAVAGSIQFSKNTETSVVTAFARDVTVFPEDVRCAKEALVLVFAKCLAPLSGSVVEAVEGSSRCPVELRRIGDHDRHSVSALRGWINAMIDAEFDSRWKKTEPLEDAEAVARGEQQREQQTLGPSDVVIHSSEEAADELVRFLRFNTIAAAPEVCPRPAVASSKCKLLQSTEDVLRALSLQLEQNKA
eukprot:m51a1_g10730 putative atp-dependent rna helicase tdrd9-like (1253) ;mRNA; r:280442-285705